LFIPDSDPDFLAIPNPGSRGEEGTGSCIRIRNTVKFPRSNAARFLLICRAQPFFFRSGIFCRAMCTGVPSVRLSFYFEDFKDYFEFQRRAHYVSDKRVEISNILKSKNTSLF
jgi:hypothetical protein